MAQSLAVASKYTRIILFRLITKQRQRKRIGLIAAAGCRLVARRSGKRPPLMPLLRSTASSVRGRLAAVAGSASSSSPSISSKIANRSRTSWLDRPTCAKPAALRLIGFQQLLIDAEKFDGALPQLFLEAPSDRPFVLEVGDQVGKRRGS